MKNFLVTIMIGVFFIGACSVAPGTPTDQTVSDLDPPTQDSIPDPNTLVPELTVSEVPGDLQQLVNNARYQLGFSDQIREIQFQDGRYQEAQPGDQDYQSIFITDFLASGNLIGDDQDEVAVVVAENYGGTGTFVFLAVYQFINNEPEYLTSIFIDDRPIVNEMFIKGDQIFIDAVIHDRNDPACCPSLETTRNYFLSGLNLVMSDYSTKTPMGDPRTITIEAPVDGIEVSGSIRVKGNITISPFENNLIYRIYDMGGVELSAGPVNVEAPDLGAPGSFERAIDLGNILANTTIRITIEDLNIADGSLFAMDSVILQVR